MTREERDLLVRWVRDLRREPISPELRSRIMRHPEALYRRLQGIDPRSLPSIPSPRAPTLGSQPSALS